MTPKDGAGQPPPQLRSDHNVPLDSSPPLKGHWFRLERHFWSASFSNSYRIPICTF